MDKMLKQKENVTFSMMIEAVSHIVDTAFKPDNLASVDSDTDPILNN